MLLYKGACYFEVADPTYCNLTFSPFPSITELRVNHPDANLPEELGFNMFDLFPKNASLQTEIPDNGC